MSKGYFIVLPRGHDEDMYYAYCKVLNQVSGVTKPTTLYYRGALYLVFRPFEPNNIRYGSLPHKLVKLRENPNMIELHPYMENV